MGCQNSKNEQTEPAYTKWDGKDLGARPEDSKPNFADYEATQAKARAIEAKELQLEVEVVCEVAEEQVITKKETGDTDAVKEADTVPHVVHSCGKSSPMEVRLHQDGSYLITRPCPTQIECPTARSKAECLAKTKKPKKHFFRQDVKVKSKLAKITTGSMKKWVGTSIRAEEEVFDEKIGVMRGNGQLGKEVMYVDGDMGGDRMYIRKAREEFNRDLEHQDESKDEVQVEAFGTAEGLGDSPNKGHCKKLYPFQDVLAIMQKKAKGNNTYEIFLPYRTGVDNDRHHDEMIGFFVYGKIKEEKVCTTDCGGEQQTRYHLHVYKKDAEVVQGDTESKLPKVTEEEKKDVDSEEDSKEVVDHLDHPKHKSHVPIWTAEVDLINPSGAKPVLHTAHIFCDSTGKDLIRLGKFGHPEELKKMGVQYEIECRGQEPVDLIAGVCMMMGIGKKH